MIKTIADYEDQICKKFPQVPKKDILKILHYGWKLVYLCNSYGGDVLIVDHKDKFYFFTGYSFVNALRYFLYYLIKLYIKATVMYKRRRVKWDGYYYFACTNPQQENIEEQLQRNCKSICYGNLILYKNPDECKIKQWNRHYIYRINFGIDFGRTLYRSNFTSKDVEFYEYKPSIKFPGILVSTKNNYKYI